jgi:hypothetical protein
MATGDGGHVWPPRASDPRIQEVTGLDASGSTPDAVFDALRAAGYTGSLDDMWHQHLAALSITDTSEPFEDPIGTEPPWGEHLPDTWTLEKTWTDGGANDLNPIISNHTTPRYTAFDMNSDGTHVFNGNSSDDFDRGYTLSTPWDFSSATYLSGTGRTNTDDGGLAKGAGDGLIWWNISATDTIRTHNTDSSTPYFKKNADTLRGDAVDTEMGSGGSGDGCAAISDDGTALYWWIDNGVGVRLARAAMSTVWDPDTIGTPVEHDSSATFPTIAVLFNSLLVSPDEAHLLYLDNEIVYLGTMSTPGDITSLSWNTTNTLALPVSSTQYGKMYVNPQFTKAFICSTTASDVQILEYSIP